MVLCDTHALIFDALDPKRLGARATRAIGSAYEAGELACADISLWEIVMLLEKGRLRVDAAPAEFLDTLIAARRLRVLAIEPSVAALAASALVPAGDPADRLICATALAHGAELVTRDRRLRGIPNLKTIW